MSPVGQSAGTMLDIDVAGLAHVSRGRDRDRARAGGHHLRAAGRARAARHARRRRRQVRRPQRGELGARPARPGAEGRRARAAALRADRELAPGRLALLAAARRRRGGLALHADRGVRVRLAGPRRATRTPRSSSSSSRARSSSTSRSRTSRARRGTSPRTTRASSATPSSTGSPAASARRRARRGSRTTSPARARPRASPARTSPTATQHLDYDTFQEHIAPNTTSDFAFKGALRDEATAVWRGMIRVEQDAQKTNAYQENRNLLLSDRGACRLDPRPRDPGQRRALHPRRDARPGRPRAALLPDGPRPLARARPSA